MTRLLFSTGTGRGGTNLVAKMLNVSPAAAVASDPFLPLFKTLRSAALKEALGLDLDPEAPVADHYFLPGSPRALKAVYAADLGLRLPPSWRPGLLAALAKRMSLSCENLIPFLPELTADTHRGLFEQALASIPKAHGKRPALTGFNDNWAVEFFPALARAFPDARFLLVVRDPRAAICSALRQKDASRIAPVLSFARGWRKNAAYAAEFRRDPLLKERLKVVTYEALVASPEATLEDLCAWLDLPFLPAMLDPRNYVDGGGRPWKANSHVHESLPSGIFPDSIRAWEAKMPPGAAECVELVCGLEMPAYGYESRHYKGGLLSEDACAFLAANDKAPASYRSGGAVDDEVRSELFRRQLLAFPRASWTPGAVEANFLFQSALEECLVPA